MNLPNMEESKKRTDKTVEYIYNNTKDNRRVQNQKYFIRTYGCQMNVHDSEEISARVESLGYTKTEEMTESNLIILNTCAIRENAHDKVFGFLGRCKHLKSKNKDLIIVVCGCMAQQTSVCEEILNKHSYIDIIVGTHNLNELQDYLLDKNKNQIMEVYSMEGNVYENIPYKRDSNIKAWVNIMLGCNNFCTYCIVPYARGKQRSRHHEDIIKEIKQLVSDGYQEVTLLGQNVNSYGLDLENEVSFAELLKLVSESGINRIRFVTSNPWDFTDDIIEVVSTHDNIMPYIHLPIQSGSNNILKKMNRKYTKESYLELFNKIKNKVVNVSITTDIIVGFPGETEEEFKETLDIVEKCQFDGAFTFIYSPRESTIAAKMEDNVLLEEKEERLRRLNKIVNKYSLENNKKYLNKTVSVLIEGISEKDNARVFGYTDTMKLVNIEGDKSLIGSIVDIHITDAKSFSLNGKVKISIPN